MRPLDVVAVAHCSPDARLCHGPAGPVKRAARLRLWAPAQHHRVVHARAAEAVAKLGVHRVGRGPGIDEQRTARDRQRQRKRIRMRMAAVEEPVRACVEDEMVSGRGARHVVAARAERHRRGCWRLGRHATPRAPRRASRPLRARTDSKRPVSQERGRGASVGRQSSALRPQIGNSCPPSSSPSCGRIPAWSQIARRYRAWTRTAFSKMSAAVSPARLRDAGREQVEVGRITMIVRR